MECCRLVAITGIDVSADINPHGFLHAAITQSQRESAYKPILFFLYGKFQTYRTRKRCATRPKYLTCAEHATAMVKKKERENGGGGIPLIQLHPLSCDTSGPSPLSVAVSDTRLAGRNCRPHSDSFGKRRTPLPPPPLTVR